VPFGIPSALIKFSISYLTASVVVVCGGLRMVGLGRFMGVLRLSLSTILSSGGA